MKPYKFFSIMLIILISIPIFSFTATGNVEPAPTFVGSDIAVENRINTTFISANVRIIILNNYSICEGSYKFFNPTQTKESFNLLFDPGRYPDNVTIIIDKNEVPYIETKSEFHWYKVLKFPVDVDAYSLLTVNITWEINTVTNVKDFQWGPMPFPVARRYQRNRDCCYYIIGTRSWKDPIEYVNISFEIRTYWFHEYKITYYRNDDYNREEGMPYEVNDNEFGYKTLYFNFTNFSDESLEIQITGNHDNITNYYYSVMLIEGLFFLFVFIGIIIIIKSKKGVKKKT